MDDESGGWMLIGYTPEFNSPGDTPVWGSLPYPNYWEGGEGTFDRMRVLASDLWYHDGSAQCDSVMKMASTTFGLTPLLTNMEIANKVVYTNPDNLQIIETSPTTWTITNNTPMTGTWYPVKGHTLMTGPLTVNAPGDWIHTSDSWWTVCGPSIDLNATGRPSGPSNLQGTSSWTNPLILQSTTGHLYGMRDVAESGTLCRRTDIKTYAVYVK
jgi:hypothetical protein